jgi:hypothetical protein
MSSRKPPSQRDPEYLLARTALSLRQVVGGSSRMANNTPVTSSARQMAQLRGAPRPATPSGGSGAPRPATVVVAASDSTAGCQVGADVVCTGTADQSAINAAISGLTDAYSLLLLPGTYHFTDRLPIEPDYSTISGPGSTIHYLTPYAMSRPAVVLDGAGTSARDLTIVIDPTCPGQPRGINVWGNQSRAERVQVLGGGVCAYGIDISAPFAGATGCFVSDAYTSYAMSDVGCSLTDSTSSGSVTGVEVYGQDNRVEGCTFYGGTVAGGMGDGIYLDRGGALRALVVGNSVTTHYVGIDAGARECVITGNIVSLSQRTGIDSYGRDTKVSENHVSGSSQETDNTYANILVGGSHGIDDDQSVTGNTCRAQTADKFGALSGNSAKYGLSVTGTGVFVSHNDLLGGGATAAYSDSGTGTVTGAANRT